MASQYAPRDTVLESATRLSDVHSDSGYGGSLVDGDSSIQVPLLNSEHRTESEKIQWAGNTHQLAYNQNRVALGRSINRTVDTLKRFQVMNAKWPAHYPSVQRPESPTLNRTQSSAIAGPSGQRPLGRRAATSIGDFVDEPKPIQEPRLVTPRITEDFNVLKLDLRLGAASPSELVHSLEKSAVASLLDGKIAQSVKHLHALRERIEDTASKVLVTGDLNAGKSTFCNALLRKKVLPEDQQPCTSVFCEVLDARENSNIEEVHAIVKDGPTYNRHDESTYDVYSIEKLEDIVVDNDKYGQLKVYVEDVRTVDQSLLRNGVVDIALIDAPGLNEDAAKTTAIFARQEEIDVVVFVVSAENRFTLSAKEFIWNAAHEKAYIFIVVNRFDNIRDQARCQRIILEQLAHLSPRTHQDAKELVHFVSSNAVIDGQEPEKVKKFENLEQSLRSFVLEKRARSKLAPAKTYMLNLLGDLETLAQVNKDVTTAELEKVIREIEEITPAFEECIKTRVEVSEEVDRTIEETTRDVYNNSRSTISSTIEHIDEAPGVAYSGLLSAWAYAEATKRAMLEHIQASIVESEGYCRKKTTQSVASINGLGLLHLDSDYVTKTFTPEGMFSRRSRKDQGKGTINVEIDLFDFFDFEHQEKVIGGSTALTLATVATSQLWTAHSWFDGLWKAVNVLGVKNSRKLILPALIVAAIAGGAYMASDVPGAVPRQLAKKIRTEAKKMDYAHAASDRISKESRKVLRHPAENVRSCFQRSVERQGQSLEEKKAIKKESEVAAKYFGNLLREAKEQKSSVSALDLEPQVL